MSGPLAHRTNLRYTSMQRLEQCGRPVRQRDLYAALHREKHSHRVAGGFARPPDMSARLVLEDRLDFNARVEFSMKASELVQHTNGSLDVDCGAIQFVDEPLIGLLTWLSRNARQRGLRVVLERPTPALLAALERAGVIDRFVRDEA